LLVNYQHSFVKTLFLNKFDDRIFAPLETAKAMKNRSLVSIDDLTTEEVLKILDDAVEFEKKPVQKLL